MLLTLIYSSNPLRMIPLLLMGFICFLFSISVHESAHALSAYKLGDPTARSLGRISLNPMKHIDPIGLVLWLFLGFGWAKPVPIASRYFKKPKRDLNIVSLAGPLSNFAIALVILLIGGVFSIFDINIFGIYLFSYSGFVTATTVSGLVIQLLQYGLWYMVFINVTLGVFNLLPIPPLDGSKLLLSLLPNHIAQYVYRYERYIQIALFVLVISGGARGIVSTLSDWVLNAFVWLVNLIFLPF